MNRDPIHILSTKILDEAILQQAESKNILIDCIPFIQIETLDTIELQQQVVKAIEKKTYLIFTSANAVDAVSRLINRKPQLKVFCISGKTRNAVEKKFPGSSIVDDAPNGVELAEKIIERQIGSAVFFCGDKRLNTIPDKFRDNKIQLQELVVYETVLIPTKIEKSYDGILFFSPSAVESFFSVNDSTACKVAFSFAASTHHALQPIISEITVSQTPSEQGMLNAVIDYYKPNS